MNPQDELAKFGTGELRQEIKRREEEERKKLEASRAERAVIVVCPGCNGTGKTKGRDWQSGYETEDPCLTCNQNGRITAYKV